MLPRLGAKYAIEIEVITKPRAEYRMEAGPKAPAIKIGDEVIVEGRDIEERELENLIEQRLLKK